MQFKDLLKKKNRGLFILILVATVGLLVFSGWWQLTGAQHLDKNNDLYEVLDLVSTAPLAIVVITVLSAGYWLSGKITDKFWK